MIQWLPAPLAFAYAKLGRPGRMRGVDYAGFVMDGTGWRNASLSECLPSSGWRVLPAFGLVCGGLRRLGLSPSLALPYLNLLLRKRRAETLRSDAAPR